MKFRHCLLLTLLTFAVNGFAQIVIHDSDLLAIGSTYTWGQVEQANFLVGQAGPDQIWTFGTYEFDEIGVTDIISPQDGPHGQQFPTATRVVYNHTPGIPSHQMYYYFRVATEGQYYLGGEDTQYLTVLSREVLSTPFPLQYQTEWTAISTDTTEVMPGLTIISIDTTSSIVDGWGNVQTPFGTYACLRTFNRTRLYSYENGSFTDSWEYISYAWINQSGNDIVRCRADEGITDPNFSTGNIIMMDVPLDVAANHAAIPGGFSLGQNYPNPFNPSTEIQFNLPQPVDVELRVFNLLGEEVAWLADGRFGAGSHTVQFNGSGLASGVYVYSLKANGYQDEKRMLLLK